MNILKDLWEQEKLTFYGSSEKYHNHYAFKELLDICYSKEWFPYCKKTFNEAKSVIKYPGKYTHRIAISNYRIIRMDENTVTFFVKDYRNEDKWKELTLSGVEFIRRFLMDVPQMLEHLYGINICICKHCGGRMGRPEICFPMCC